MLQVGYHVLGVDHPKTVRLRKRFGVLKVENRMLSYLAPSGVGGSYSSCICACVDIPMAEIVQFGYVCVHFE